MNSTINVKDASSQQEVPHMILEIHVDKVEPLSEDDQLEENILPVEYAEQMVCPEEKPTAQKQKYDIAYENYLKRATIRIYKSERKKSFLCPLCSKKFGKLPVLRSHILRHIAPGTSFGCTVCTEVYATSERLRKHFKRRHIPRYKCLECSYKFVRSKHLEEHMREHYSCKTCGRTFVEKTLWLDHIKKHALTEYPIVCVEKCAEPEPAPAQENAVEKIDSVNCSECEYRLVPIVEDDWIIHLKNDALKDSMRVSLFRSNLRVSSEMWLNFKHRSILEGTFREGAMIYC